MTRLVIAAAILVAAPSLGQTPPSAAQLQSAMAGSWDGALGYRDYQSNELFELPVKTDIRSVPDGVTIVRTSTYDDGPQTGMVWITSTMFFGKSGTLTTFVARKAREPETITETVRISAYRDATHWTIVYQRDGLDDEKPALVRTTEVRDGDTVLATKDVMPKSETTKGWQFRNQLRLIRKQ